ncbi:hypothetical protein PybrP1_011985 [[Pythium] brassicae (nom. inval.)]|nr:hypothetical protein PybrP1_011985 [[Pythium] brassicae (nom. inval.)]
MVNSRSSSVIDLLRESVASSWRASDMPAHLRHSDGSFRNARGQNLSYVVLFPSKHEFAGVALVGPSVAVEWRPMLRVQALFARPMSAIVPKLRIVPAVKAELLCRDPAYLEDYINDPLTLTDHMTMRMGEQSLHAMLALHKDPRFSDPSSAFCRLPVLFVIGSEDKVVSVPAAVAFFDKLRSADKTIHVLAGMFHTLFDDPEKDEVFDKLLAWLHSQRVQTPPTKDHLTMHSYANLHEVTFSDLEWNVEIDFERQQLRGTAEYTFTYEPADAAQDAHVVVLDTHHLSVEKAFVDGEEAAFELLPRDAVFGSALVVPITRASRKVKVAYATTAASSGLQWLPKELTADKTHPYLFTQCQAIHARSVVPAPDTPSAKFTYTAHVTAPAWATVLLSAIAQDEGTSGDKQPRQATGGGDSTPVVSSFRQEVPIPSYLLAVAAGRLASAELGPRSRVWAEPSVVGKAAHEFAQTEEFLAHAEAITAQPYVWTRYDLVCLPPSFPYGGMENPCLTFVTPTLLAGDRSLADVVAHEIAHSWTGNLVTNRSWRDFWLNEGWTMWLERKIQARQYIRAFRFRTLTSEDFRAFFEQYFTETVDRRAALAQIDWHAWFHAPGLPPVAPRFDTTLSSQALALAEQMLARPDDPSAWAAVVSSRALKKWPAALWILLLDTLLLKQQAVVAEAVTLATTAQGDDTANTDDKNDATATVTARLFTPAHVDAIDAFAHHHLTTTHNAELRFRWYTLLLRAGDLRLRARTEAFLGEQGRMKYVRPLFRDLRRAAGAAEAARVFDACKRLYHPIAAKMIQRDLDDAAAPKPTTTAAATPTANQATSTTTTAAKATATTTTTGAPASKTVKKTTTIKTTTTTGADGVVRVTKEIVDVKLASTDGDAVDSGDNSRPDANVRLARLLGIPRAYASYSPVAALALSAAVVATVLAVVKRR